MGWGDGFSGNLYPKRDLFPSALLLYEVSLLVPLQRLSIKGPFW